MPSSVRVTVRCHEKASWFELAKSWLEGLEDMGSFAPNKAKKPG